MSDIGNSVSHSVSNAINLMREIEYLQSEVARLKGGRFTDEELQNLCHNLSQEDACKFKAGCEEYQKKLFGKGALEDEREACCKIVEGAEPWIGSEWVRAIVDEIRSRGL